MVVAGIEKISIPATRCNVATEFPVTPAAEVRQIFPLKISIILCMYGTFNDNTGLMGFKIK